MNRNTLTTKMLKDFCTNINLLIVFCYVEFILTFQNVRAQQVHYDTRCICICKGDSNFPSDAVYVESPFPNTSSICTCPNVVLPRLSIDIQKSSLRCLGCHCKFESRSILKIQIAVAIVIVVTFGLVSYCIILIFLQSITKERYVSKYKGRLGTEYFDHQDGYETFGFYDSLGAHEEDYSPTPSRTRYVVEETFRKLKNKQDKWTKQLEIQRSKIYN